MKTEEKNNKRIALYLRACHENSEMVHKMIKSQEKAGRFLAKKLGYSVKLYIDTTKNPLPAKEKLLSELSSKKYQAVYFYSLDRFTRNTIELFCFRELLHKNKIKLFYENGIEFN